MKILHVSTYGDVVPCGIADYTRDLMESLEGKGIIQDNFVLKVSTFTHAKKEYEKLYAEIIEKSKEFDIVHIQHQFGFFRTGKHYIDTLMGFFKFLEKLKAKKVFVTFHTEPLFYKNFVKVKKTKFKRFIYRLRLNYQWKKLLSLCKEMEEKGNGKFNFVAHNELVTKSLLTLGFSLKCIHQVFLPVKIIQNRAIETSYFQEKIKNFKKENEVLVGIIGFLEAHKGIGELIEAVRVLPRNYKLVLCGGQRIAGDSQFLETVRKQIYTNVFLKNRVLITGYVPEGELHYCFDLIDIFAFPYHGFFASSSAAIGLACQAQKPIITSRIKCFEEITKVYNCFEMVSAHTSYELADAIQRISSNKEKAKELVSNIRKFVDENHWEVSSQKFMSFYQKVG
ncbi:MAG: hypothetical protein C5B43_02240 [Verrucomicrobia bacterium]|nr:MAG: hypothetical protein C5B43_02240 [Verrucomicrobiota bacterium]